MLKSDSSSDEKNSWLITTCPSCSKQIKAKKEVLKSTLSIACPYCQYPLNLRDQEPSRISKPKYSQAEIQKKEALDKYGAEGSGKNLPFSTLSDKIKKKDKEKK